MMVSTSATQAAAPRSKPGPEPGPASSPSGQNGSMPVRAATVGPHPERADGHSRTVRLVIGLALAAAIVLAGRVLRSNW